MVVNLTVICFFWNYSVTHRHEDEELSDKWCCGVTCLKILWNKNATVVKKTYKISRFVLALLQF